MGKRFKLEIGGFDELITCLDELEADIKGIMTDILDGVGEDVGVRTKEAMANQNLPRQGKYSSGDTKKSTIINPETQWEGLTATIDIGFDKSQKGVGGLLITGTPKMRPNWKLEDIYVNKGYMKRINSDISDRLSEEILDALGG